MRRPPRISTSRRMAGAAGIPGATRTSLSSSKRTRRDEPPPTSLDGRDRGVSPVIGGCGEEKDGAVTGTTPGAGGTPVYTCPPTPADPASVWPIPGGAETTPSGVYTKRIRKGMGRTPAVGSGQVLILCVTYYDRKGAVVQYDPAVVHDVDLPPKE